MLISYACHQFPLVVIQYGAAASTLRTSKGRFVVDRVEVKVRPGEPIVLDAQDGDAAGAKIDAIGGGAGHRPLARGRTYRRPAQ